MIFWIDNTSIYDCRTYSLIKPQQYDVAIILDYIKQEQQQNRIDVKEKLPKLLKTLALLLIIHNKNDIFRLLQILASKDFNQTKLFNDFMNNPAALWYIEQMKVEPVQMIMHQYILGEFKFLEGLFQKIISSYDQYLLKLQNGQVTQEFNLQGELQSNQNQTSQNKKKGRFHKNQKQENQYQINRNQVSEVQLDQKSPEEVKSNQDSINPMINTEQAQKQNLEVIQQQQINKEKTLISSIEIEDKTLQQQQQNESNRQQQAQQQVIQNQKHQNNIDNPKGSYFSEQQKISLESVFKDDLPDQKLPGMATMQSDKVQQQQNLPSSKSKSNPKQKEQITEMSEKINNTEQILANNNFNNESDKINQLSDTLSDKEQQEFDFSQDTELIKLYDLLKEKCQQNYWWSKFQDRCHKAMSDKELELILFEKLPILMKRWAIKTRKNVTEIETTLTRLHRAPDQEKTNILVDNQNSDGQKIIHISSSPEKFDYTKLIDDNNLNQNQKNSIKNPQDFQQPQIHKQQDHLDYINKESNHFTSRADDDTFINQNQLLQNEIQEVTPYQIIDIDNEIFKSSQGDINKKGQSSKIIKTASNRLNSEITKSKEIQPENVDKQLKLQETQQQQSHSNKSNIICIESSNDEIISKPQQPTFQQQKGEGIKIQNQNNVCSTFQQGNNQMNDDIDNLFQDNNDIDSPDSIVSSSSILISDQSSIQFGETQANKKQKESREQINQQKNKDIQKEPEKNVEKPNTKEQREEEQKSRDKKLSESDIDVKDKQKNKNNKRQHQKERSENSKTRSKKDSKEKKRAKSSQQSKRKEKSKDNKRRKSSERKSGQDILKQMQAEKEAKERLKEEQKKKEKERIHQENIKKAEIRLQKLRSEEIEFQKEQEYLQQQAIQKEIKERELKEQQQYQHQHQHHHHHHQHKKYQQNYQQSYQNYKNDNQIQEQNQKTKPFDRQVQDQQYGNTDAKFKHHNQNHNQNYNQQNQQKIQESQSFGNRSQQYNQGHEKSMMPHSQQNKQWDSQNNQQFHQQNQKQNDRHQRNQNSNEQVNAQQNQQQQRQNSYAFPLEQYGIQEFLTKKDQTIQKNIQKSIVNPVQYDLEQVQSPSIKQNNYRKQQQQQQQQQYPQQFQQQQYESQQQQQPFQQQQQYQHPQQQQFYNNQKPRDNKFRNQSPHRQQGFYRQKQNYQNHQEPHIKKQRKFNPYHEQYSNNQSFNHNQGPSNMHAQPYPYQDQRNNNQMPYKNSSSYPTSPIHSSNQPSKQQMFEFFCSMFYDKFQQTE
ncbi:unnamed protein product (macronuclear) [Paramecium tetraurelia]|uniref:Uncharacterized protein n=1 Tax=Paramecium tetraurelia TaxID=5888 RepID=A0BIW9_PARTE|nr:uncharacterized protein GSPATT00004859001 [Paramecium tetraurelia]CAK58486.1 unnamed protein product [Paramecium tetraurelia]|eukprot:XP_001425884.1 hypothetical protein (macronuclear) [Paramecium tetraurelia strain d4-2]